MKRPLAVFLVAIFLGLLSVNAFAVPVLQVGAPAGSGDIGLYADYQKEPNPPPSETDTAITSGSTILVAGAFANGVNKLGGWLGGDNYSAYFGLPSIFDSQDGAILLVSVPDGRDASSLRVNGGSSFFSSSTVSFFPNNHDPLKADVSDFYFFNIGNFSNVGVGNIPNFVTETTGRMLGSIKELEISGMGGLAWIHFDVVALETDEYTRRTRCITSTFYEVDYENNPGSKDVTWKPPQKVPEPGVLLLLGSGLIGLAVVRRRIRK